MYGTITLYNTLRGFGFLTAEGQQSGQQYFFHISHFAKGESPVLGGRVRFDVGPPISIGKKPQALNVQYIHDTGAIVGVSNTTSHSEGAL